MKLYTFFDSQVRSVKLNNKTKYVGYSDKKKECAHLNNCAFGPKKKEKENKKHVNTF